MISSNTAPKKRRWLSYHLAALVPVVSFILVSCDTGPPLPEHTVERALLYDNNVRVTVKSPGELTEGQCEALIVEYRSIAGSGGQVAVRKPSSRLEGQMLPWCVDNMDGKGVTYNTHWFD